jgi:hypothetical protein
MLEADGVLYDDEMMRAVRDRTQRQMIDHQTRMAAAANPAGTTSVSEDIAARKHRKLKPQGALAAQFGTTTNALEPRARQTIWRTAHVGSWQILLQKSEIARR